MKTTSEVAMRKPRKKISKMGWGVRWHGEKIDFFFTKRAAMFEIEYWSAFNTAILFRCKIEEVTK